MMMVGVSWITWRDPSAGPAAERSTWAERLTALRNIWGVALLVVVVLGGIYGGCVHRHRRRGHRRVGRVLLRAAARHA